MTSNKGCLEPMDSAAKFFQKVWASFPHAFRGLWTAIQIETNMRVHLGAASCVVLSGLFFSYTGLEWALLVLAIGAVLAAEIFNTAVERVVDLVSPDYHPLAKQAKDLAAAGVLLAAVMAAFIGLLVIGPHLLNLIKKGS